MRNAGIALAIIVLAAVTVYPAAVRAADTSAPPSGLSSTTMSLADLLAAARKADGTDHAFSSRIERGIIAAYGLKGTFRLVQSGNNYRGTSQLGNLASERGSLDGQSWSKNENGLVRNMRSNQNNFSNNAPSAAGFAGFAPSELHLIGETDGPAAAYVVEANPKEG